MPFRISALFALTTDPTVRTDASPHSGSWSENLWTQVPISSMMANYLAVLQARAVLLPYQVSIIGWRSQQFTISGNKLLPGGSSAAKLNYPGGRSSFNLPQDGLRISVTAAGVPQNTRLVLGALPDTMISNGEYQPTAAFRGWLNAYFRQIQLMPSAGWVGRDLTQGSSRVMALIPPVLTTDVAIPGLLVGDWIRFHRVLDDDGRAVEGAFRVTNIAGGVNYTLAHGPEQNVSTPNGLVRKDLLTFLVYDQFTPDRAVPRKIGRPFASYRGRRSRATR